MTVNICSVSHQEHVNQIEESKILLSKIDKLVKDEKVCPSVLSHTLGCLLGNLLTAFYLHGVQDYEIYLDTLKAVVSDQINSAFKIKEKI